MDSRRKEEFKELQEFEEFKEDEPGGAESGVRRFVRVISKSVIQY
jgi:hypothetical protein